jgi:hypothetical protein
MAEITGVSLTAEIVIEAEAEFEVTPFEVTV